MDIQHFYTETLRLKDMDLVRTLTINSKFKFFKKGVILENVGCISQELYFLEYGLIRGFFLDDKGKDITDCFGFRTGTPITSCPDLNAPSPIGLEILEDSSLLSIPHSVVMFLLNKNLEAANLYNQFLRDSLKAHWENKIALIQHTAVERYQWFLKAYPGLIERVNHRYVASFLGMTSVSLSRIRRTIKNNEI